MSSRYTPIVEALLAIESFKLEVMDHLLANIDDEVLDFLINRCGAESVLNRLDTDTVVQFAFDSCRPEVEQYMTDNCSLNVQEFELDW